MTLSESAAGPPSILVVDDEEVLRRVLARELRKKGFEVYSSASGTEAVELYCRSGVRIDLILMDVQMPGLSGPAALDEIRAVAPDVRCCFITANRSADMHAELLSRGALAVFWKPFGSLSELARALHQFAGRTIQESQLTAEEVLQWKN